MDTFSEYLLLTPLGESSHASVFLSFNKTHKRFCVLKLFNKYNDNFQQQSLREEYEVYQTLRQLNINVTPDFYNFCTETWQIKNLGENRQPYGFLELEFGQYGDLLNLVKKYHENENRMGLPERIAKFLFWQVIMAIDEMHSKKMAHLDIKPENVIILQDLKIKLIDFGFTQRAPANGLVFGNKGTKGFQAPESKEMGLYDAFKADVYSAGISLWQIVAPCVALREIDTRVSRACSSLIRGMIATNPKKRMDLEQVKNHEWFAEMEDSQTLKDELQVFMEKINILNMENFASFPCEEWVKDSVRDYIQGSKQSQSVEGSEPDDSMIGVIQPESDMASDTAQAELNAESSLLEVETPAETALTTIIEDNQKPT